MASSQPANQPGGFQPGYRWRMLGTPAPVFPGFEVDICERIEDADKPDAVWHRERSRAMLRAHPEIKDLMGTTPRTAVWCVAFALGQVALAAWAMAWPWWVVVAVAYGIGSWININLFSLAHECNHALVFKKPAWNRWLFTFTSLPMFLSSHHTWWIEHAVHHNDLGAKKDFISRRRSFFLVTRYTPPLLIPYSLFMLITQVLRSGLGLLCFGGDLLRGRREPGRATLSVLADEHLITGYHKYRLQRWAVAYPLLSLVMLGVLFVWGGWKPVVYLLLAQSFMTGFLHPVMFGLILSNSHFHGFRTYQPSSSYYGWLNKLTFNFGLHTEHHDIAKVPWDKLPRLREIAPEFYDNLAITKSYAALAMKFVFGAREDFDNQESRNRDFLELAPGSTKHETAQQAAV
jgi:sphingolipid delta-4 desaturase